MRRAYQTDISHAQWAYIKAHLPPPKAATGRPRIHPLREIVDAIFYIVKSGCAWRLLPHDFPPWQTVYHYFRTWRIDGTWEKMNAALRQRVRVRAGRNPQPSAGVVDSQSVKTTGVGGEERGYDGAKKVKGRKRHLLVDTQGLVLKTKVHSAAVTDRVGIKLLLERVKERFPRLTHLWLDAGYNGREKGADWVEKALGWTTQIVRRAPKVAPEEVMKAWVREWNKSGVTIDWQKLLPPKEVGASSSSSSSSSSGEAVDRGTYLFMDRAEQEDEQRLREAVRNERGVHLGGDEPPYGEALGACLRVFRRFLATSRFLAWGFREDPHPTCRTKMRPPVL